MSHHLEFERLTEELHPSVEQRRTIPQLTRSAVEHALCAHDQAERGDADQLIAQVTIAAAQCYQVVLQLGGNLDEELERYRDEVRAARRLSPVLQRISRALHEGEALSTEGT